MVVLWKIIFRQTDFAEMQPRPSCRDRNGKFRGGPGRNGHLAFEGSLVIKHNFEWRVQWLRGIVANHHVHRDRLASQNPRLVNRRGENGAVLPRTGTDIDEEDTHLRRQGAEIDVRPVLALKIRNVIQPRAGCALHQNGGPRQHWPG